MSKNKDIEFLHQVTGKSYKECRQLYTLYHGDIYAASGLDVTSVLDSILKITDAITETFNKIADGIRKAVDSIDWDAVNEAFRNTDQFQELPEINEQDFMSDDYRL